MTENKRDYYEVLGVPEGADEDALKKTYRKLTKKYHSNADPGDKTAEAKSKEASETYGVLSDPQERQQYDRFGHAVFEQDGAGAGGFGDGFGGFDFGGDMGDIFGNIFGDIFNGGKSGRARSGPSRGVNIKTSVRITSEEAVFGCDKEIEINFKETCASHHGTGAKAGTSPQTCSKCNGKDKIMYTQWSFFGAAQNMRICPDCNGAGQVIEEKCPDYYGTGYKTVRKKFKVSIPAGIDNGQCVHLAGGGEPGTNGGERGDLPVEAVVSQHPIFRRQDTSIYSTVPISFARVALGGPIRIKTVDGEMGYDVRLGTQTNTEMRLKGKGVPSLRSRSVRGDRCITLAVQAPECVNQTQKEALRRFDDVMSGVTFQEEEKPEKKGIFKQIGNSMGPDRQYTEPVQAFLHLFSVMQ